MRISKKILACVLAALMAISMMPLTVFAATIQVADEAALNEAIANAASGDTIKLTAEIEVTDTVSIPADKKITINLNSKKLFGAVNGKLISNAGNLTLSGYGNIYNTDVTAQGHDSVYNTGTLKISSGMYIGDSDTDRTNANAINRGAAVRNYGGTVTISNGYYTAIDNSKDSSGKMTMYAYALINDNNGTMTISGGTVYGKNNGNVCNNSGLITITGGTYSLAKGENQNYYNIYAGGGDVTVNGGTFTTTDNTAAVYTAAGQTITINDGTFNYATKFQQSSVGTVIINGGNFSGNVSAFFAEGVSYFTIPDGSGDKVIVNANTPAVYKNGIWKPCDSVVYAVACAADDTTVYVLKDVADDAHDTFGNGNFKPTNAWLRGNKDITLDLQGHNVTTNYGSETETTVDPSLKLGNGKGTTDTLTIVSSAPATFTTAYGIRLGDKNALTIGENVTLKSTKSTFTAYIDAGAKNSTITVNGTVENAGTNGTALYINGSVADATNTITVNGTAIGKSAGIYAPGKGTYNVNGTVEGATGIYVKQGTVNVAAGAKVKGTGAKVDYIAAGNGFYPTGDAIAADSMLATAPVTNVAAGATLESDFNKGYQAYPAESTAVANISDGAIIIEHEYEDTMSITVDNNIDLNINIDTTNDEIETLEYTFSDPYSAQEGSSQTVTKAAADDSTPIKIQLSPAQIMDEITVTAKDENGEVVRTVTTSIAEYCTTIIESTTSETITEELKELAKATLDYGKAASGFFNYNETAFAGVSKQLSDPDLSSINPEKGWYNRAIFTMTDVTYRATSVPELRFYVSDISEADAVEYNKYMECSDYGTAKFVKLADGQIILQVTDINIVKFAEEFTVTASGADLLDFTPISWVKSTIAKSSNAELVALAKSIGNYYLASVDYFA